MAELLGLAFWVGIAYVVWHWVRKRKTRGISLVAKPVSTITGPEPSNNDIMRNLEQIEQSIEIVEAQTKKVQKSVRDISHWLWLLPIGFIIGLYWDNIVAVFKFLFPGLLTGLFLLIGLLFWGGIAYGIGYIIWRLVRIRKTLEIPPVASSVRTAPTPVPFNSDIMRYLNRIEESIKSVEAQTKKVEKSVKDISSWLWWLPIGFIIGLYWDDIVSFIFKSLFSVGQ